MEEVAEEDNALESSFFNQQNTHSKNASFYNDGLNTLDKTPKITVKNTKQYTKDFKLDQPPKSPYLQTSNDNPADKNLRLPSIGSKNSTHKVSQSPTNRKTFFKSKKNKANAQNVSESIALPFNKTKVGEIRSFLEQHEDKINQKIKDFGNSKSEFTSKLTGDFMRNRQKTIESSIERLYKSNDQRDLNENLAKYEKNPNFCSEMKIWQQRVNTLKTIHNDIAFKIESLQKKNAHLDKIISSHGIKKNIQKETKLIENVNETHHHFDFEIENELLQKEVQDHMLECYRSDIFILQKNTEQVKAVKKKLDIMQHDLNYDLSRYKAMNDNKVNERNHISEEVIKKRGNSNPFIRKYELDSLFEKNLHNEISLFDDRIVLKNIKDHELKLHKIKQEEIIEQRKEMVRRKLRRQEEEKERKDQKNAALNKELQSKKDEIENHMVHMKVTNPDMICTRITEMRSIKEGLQDLKQNYTQQIGKLDTEVNRLKLTKDRVFDVKRESETMPKDEYRLQQKKLLIENATLKRGLNADGKMDIEFTNEKQDFDQFQKNYNISSNDLEVFREDLENRDKIIQFDKNLSTLHTIQFECEYRFKNLSNVLNDSCATVSRIMYQLQTSKNDKNVEVTNQNIVQYLSNIGMKLEKMITYVYSIEKNVVQVPMTEDDYIEIVPDKDGDLFTSKLTKSPDWLHLNPVRVEIDFNEEYLPQSRSCQRSKRKLNSSNDSWNYMHDLVNDELMIDFEKTRKDLRDETLNSNDFENTRDIK